MKNKYEARLGTERMLPLVFKMALPAVAAQFVNLLYNIVDRISKSLLKNKYFSGIYKINFITCV